MTCVGVAGSGVGFDLDAEHSPAVELGDQVNLVTTGLGAQVIQPWFGFCDNGFGAELGDHERFEHPAEHGPVADHGLCAGR